MPSAKMVPAATNEPRRGGIRSAVRGTGATSRLPRQVAPTEMNRPLKINDYIHNIRIFVKIIYLANHGSECNDVFRQLGRGRNGQFVRGHSWNRLYAALLCGLVSAFVHLLQRASLRVPHRRRDFLPDCYRSW